MTKDNKPWLDRKKYPFTSHFLKLEMGKMHYVDEGSGIPIVFVHGNGGWSYEFKELIKEMSKTNRCIAPDHIGFGFSDKPYDWNYLPKNHAKNFTHFINSLNLDKFVLVVNDWGGPIGLSYAIDNPQKIKHIIISNTWLWSTKQDSYYKKFSAIMGGYIGRFLIKSFNFFGKVILKKLFVDKSFLTQLPINI
jgi:haloalkane dehalogenase